MPYRFRLQEPFDDGVRRIAREQLGRAIGGFAPGKPRELAIHDARRRLKKVRALLRLVRPALGEKAFKTWNWDLRDAGMLLSGARDLHVMETTLESLETHAPARMKAALSAAKRAVTDARRDADTQSNGHVVDEGIERVRASLQNIASLECPDLDLAHMTRALKDCYADCRTAFSEACESGGDEAFHEWRKTTQRHWRQLLLLESAWRDFFDARAALAEDVSGLLGKDHDLAILKTFAAAHIGKGITAKQSEAIFEIAERRQDDLRAQAKFLAATLLAAKPKSLASETSAYWAAVQAQNPDGPPQIRASSIKKKSRKKSGRNGVGESDHDAERAADAGDDDLDEHLT